jgi:hypothetical protein
MDKNIADNFSKFTQNMMDSMQELQSINEKTLQTLTDQQFKSAQDFIKSGSEKIEQLGKAKTVEDAVSEQTKITASMSQMLLNNAQATMQVLTSGQKDLETLINKTVKENMDS